MPLIYNSLECEHLPVQEKALKLVPHLSEILDYGTVQNILLVKVAVCPVLGVAFDPYFNASRGQLNMLDPVHQNAGSIYQGPDARVFYGYGEDSRQGAHCEKLCCLGSC